LLVILVSLFPFSLRTIELESSVQKSHPVAVGSNIVGSWSVRNNHQVSRISVLKSRLAGMRTTATVRSIGKFLVDVAIGLQKVFPCTLCCCSGLMSLLFVVVGKRGQTWVISCVVGVVRAIFLHPL
jgi:hypothetical protein